MSIDVDLDEWEAGRRNALPYNGKKSPSKTVEFLFHNMLTDRLFTTKGFVASIESGGSAIKEVLHIENVRFDDGTERAFFLKFTVPYEIELHNALRNSPVSSPYVIPLLYTGETPSDDYQLIAVHGSTKIRCSSCFKVTAVVKYSEPSLFNHEAYEDMIARVISVVPSLLPTDDCFKRDNVFWLPSGKPQLFDFD